MEDIRIIHRGEMFEVVQGDKTSEELSFDETLGLIASLIMPKKRHCLGWMQTKEEHQKRRDMFKSYSEDINNKKLKAMIYTDVMLDVETLGNKSNYVVTQISLVPFNLSKGDVAGRSDSFSEFISIEDSLQKGLGIESDTLAWWLKQDVDVFKQQLSGSMTIKEVMDKMVDFIANTTSKDTRFWATAVLDYQSINSLSKIAGIPSPIFYRNRLCSRTIRFLWEQSTGKEFIFRNNHDAYQDCLFQIEDIVKQIKELGIWKTM